MLLLGSRCFTISVLSSIVTNDPIGGSRAQTGNYRTLWHILLHRILILLKSAGGHIGHLILLQVQVMVLRQREQVWLLLAFRGVSRFHLGLGLVGQLEVRIEEQVVLVVLGDAAPLAVVDRVRALLDRAAGWLLLFA